MKFAFILDTSPLMQIKKSVIEDLIPKHHLAEEGKASSEAASNSDAAGAK